MKYYAITKNENHLCDNYKKLVFLDNQRKHDLSLSMYFVGPIILYLKTLGQIFRIHNLSEVRKVIQ